MGPGDEVQVPFFITGVKTECKGRILSKGTGLSHWKILFEDGDRMHIPEELITVLKRASKAGSDSVFDYEADMSIARPASCSGDSVKGSNIKKGKIGMHFSGGKSEQIRQQSGGFAFSSHNIGSSVVNSSLLILASFGVNVERECPMLQPHILFRVAESDACCTRETKIETAGRSAIVSSRKPSGR
jgi:hypothetical protein